ncbi:MAG: thrombospondin type 3 repeat-containing protein, partial [Chloroflexota bacterium]|nr:thrombospondin type 3 repeat-containing protein [Chloroflexota bacterium]
MPSSSSRSLRPLTLAAASLTLVAACVVADLPSPARRAPSPPSVLEAPMISDAVHSGGTPGFYFLPPLVPDPQVPPRFEPSALPVVQIDRIEPDGTLISELATFTTLTGPGSETVRISGGTHWNVAWHTDHFPTIAAGHTYRISVWVNEGATRLGFLDVAVVGGQKDLKSLDTNEVVGLVDGRTLPIKFRIDTAAVDQDGDGALDWLDNCPGVANPDQADGDAAPGAPAPEPPPVALPDPASLPVTCVVGGPVPDVAVAFTCDGVAVRSCKDLSNVVLDLESGVRQRFEGLSGETGIFAGTGANAGQPIRTVWVKSGANMSGDGPGYGERFDNPTPGCGAPAPGLGDGVGDA